MNSSAIRLAKHAGSWYPAQSKFLFYEIFRGNFTKRNGIILLKC